MERVKSTPPSGVAREFGLAARGGQNNLIKLHVHPCAAAWFGCCCVLLLGLLVGCCGLAAVGCDRRRAEGAFVVGHSALLGTDGNKQLPSYQADAISLGAGEGA